MLRGKDRGRGHTSLSEQWSLPTLSQQRLQLCCCAPTDGHSMRTYPPLPTARTVISANEIEVDA